MEKRKRNVQIIVRVTEEERVSIEEKMKQIPTINLSAYACKCSLMGTSSYLIYRKSKRIRRSYKKSA